MGLFRRKSPTQSRSPSPPVAEDDGTTPFQSEGEQRNVMARRFKNPTGQPLRSESADSNRGTTERPRRTRYIEEDVSIFEILGPTAADTSSLENSKDIGSYGQHRTMTRVLRYCHKCRTTVDRRGMCKHCDHEYCRKCFRFPERSAMSRPPDRLRNMEDRSPTEEANGRPEKPLSRRASDPGRKTSSSDATPKLPVRMCHECRTPLDPSTRICQDCHHVQCSKCPRYKPPSTTKIDTTSTAPAKRAPADDDPPSSRTPGARQRVRYTCDKCSTLFSEGVRVCDSCGHERCRMCRREPPKRQCHPKGTRSRHSNNREDDGNGEPPSEDVRSIASAAATEAGTASLDAAAAAAKVANAASGGAGAVKAGAAEVAPVAAA